MGWAYESFFKAAEGQQRAAFINGRTHQIRESYKQRKWSDQRREKHRQDADVALFEGKVAHARESYRQGKITEEERDAIVSNSDMFLQLVKSLKASPHIKGEPTTAGDPKKDLIATWEGVDAKYGYIKITSVGSRHWRHAMPNEAKDTLVLYHDDGVPKLGRFQEVQGDCAVVCNADETGSKRFWRSESRFPRVAFFRQVRVVPDSVLRNVRNEAPPGKFFSGRDEKTTNPWHMKPWCPAPEGKVWQTAVNAPGTEPTYLDEESDRILKWIIQGGGNHCLPEARKAFDDKFKYHVWCPVTYQFLSEPQVFRSKHWFHNGDGSAQQRYFYSQNEMLERHGGLQHVPLRAEFVSANISVGGYDGGSVKLEMSPPPVVTNDAPADVRVRTLDQIIGDKFEQAEREDKIIRLG